MHAWINFYYLVVELCGFVRFYKFGTTRIFPYVVYIHKHSFQAHWILTNVRGYSHEPN